MQAPPNSEVIFDKQFSPLNNSSLIVACCMVAMNLGAKYLTLNIDPEFDEILQSSLMRKIVVFAILYLATRKFLYAIIGSVFIYIISRFILNKESKLYILKNKKRLNNNNQLTKEDLKYISNILLKTKNDESIVKSLYDSKIDELVSKLNK